MAGRAETRARLLAAAREVFARRGLRDASIDEIARTAGFTKGAFYANFAAKEDLFLAMLDERFAERAAQMHAVIETDEDPEVQARRGAADFEAHLAADPEWHRLFFEFVAHAGRDERFRAALLERYRALQAHATADYERRAASLGFELPFGASELALMTFAMGNGVAMEHLLQPEGVPEDLFASLLAVWVAGLRALASEQGAPDGHHAAERREGEDRGPQPAALDP